MKARASSRPDWLVARCVLLGIAGVLFAPSNSRADCGDYVIVGGRAPHASHSPATNQSMPERHGPMAPAGRPKPCSGPACKQSPPALPATPMPPVTVQAEQWGCLTYSIQQTSPDASAINTIVPACKPVHLSDRIYHPPRHSA
jgi:hypothetical protein